MEVISAAPLMATCKALLYADIHFAPNNPAVASPALPLNFINIFLITYFKCDLH